MVKEYSSTLCRDSAVEKILTSNSHHEIRQQDPKLMLSNNRFCTQEFPTTSTMSSLSPKSASVKEETIKSECLENSQAYDDLYSFQPASSSSGNTLGLSRQYVRTERSYLKKRNTNTQFALYSLIYSIDTDVLAAADIRLFCLRYQMKSRDFSVKVTLQKKLHYPGDRKVSQNQLDDWLFLGIASPVKSATILGLTLYQTMQDEYYTRHMLDGRIVNSDQRSGFLFQRLCSCKFKKKSVIQIKLT
ncbi:unnamed protein product, partial [Notodromas monacha]